MKTGQAAPFRKWLDELDRLSIEKFGQRTSFAYPGLIKKVKRAGMWQTVSPAQFIESAQQIVEKLEGKL